MLVIVAVYVDDLLIFSNDKNGTIHIKKKLNDEFKMKDLGPVKQCLGMRIEKTKNRCTIDQEQYIEAILERFRMTECKAVETPMSACEKLSMDDGPGTEEEKIEMANNPYQEAVGCLMYLAQCTRPDIVFAVNKLSRYNNNPGPKHWQAVKHLLRYLRGTSTFKLTYERSDKQAEIIGFVDADWGSEIDGRKSTTGYLFTSQGGAISWCSKKQQTVALSSCEAEYMALSNAVQEALWWYGVKSQLGYDQPLEIKCDNQSALKLAKNKGFNPRTKHIDIRHHFIQDTLEKDQVKLSYIPTTSQIADALTKPLDRNKIKEFRDAMGIKQSIEGEC
jgi:hypothetical protein